MGITLGYEDLNDHDQLRHDPVLALLSGKLEGHRKDCAPLAGKSTLNRLEHAPPRGEPGRYHRIGHDADALQAVLLESFIDSWKGGRPSRLVLDIDSTDDEVHGRQEGRFYHGYYNHYCFLPLYITCGGRPLLRAAEAGQRGSRRRRDRAAGPHRRTAPAAVAGTGDSASGRFLLCPRGDPGLVRGQRRRLRHRPGPELAARRDDRLGAGRRPSRSEAAGPARPPVRRVPLCHPDVTSWSRKRRVVAKAEHLPGKSNPRFVVTSLPDTFSARTVYERVYCPRGNMENAIKEQQLDLFSDRTSASRFAANQLRLLFSAFASILFVALRRALHGTRLARATAGTLRLKLLKIGARVMVSVRRVKVANGLWTPHTRPPPPSHASTPDCQGNDSTPPSETPSRIPADPPGTTAPQDQGKLAQAAVLATLAPQNTAAEPLAHARPRSSAETRPQTRPTGPHR